MNGSSAKAAFEVKPASISEIALILNCLFFLYAELDNVF